MDCRKRLLFFDCDSTLTSIEGLDVIAYEKGMEEDISKITKLGMEGGISFRESFAMRMSKLKPNLLDIEKLSVRYIESINTDVKETVSKLLNSGCELYIVSGGLQSALIEVGKYLGIPSSNIYGIDIYFSPDGNYLDFDKGSLFLEPKGKLRVIKQILKSYDGSSIQSTMFVGDGITDLETRDIVDNVVIYTNHIDRDLSISLSNVRSTKDITSLLSTL